MILGLGTDVVEIARIRRACEQRGDAFLRRILSPREFEEASGYASDRLVEFVAGRFAAKEAIAKALTCGIGRLGMSGVEISLTASGLQVRLSGPAQVHHKPGHGWHVSISHTPAVAFAVAILERREGRLDE